MDNPIYLSDLGAALTSSDPKEQQEVLEELNVGFYLDFFLIDLVLMGFWGFRFRRDL